MSDIKKVDLGGGVTIYIYIYGSWKGAIIQEQDLVSSQGVIKGANGSQVSEIAHNRWVDQKHRGFHLGDVKAKGKPKN